jgi:hypothetical protein
MQTFVETRLFTKLVQEYLSDDEYGALQQALVAYPEPATSFQALEAFESFVGVSPDGASAAASA